MVLSEANELWKEVSDAASIERLTPYMTAFQQATKSWHASGVVARLAVPPSAAQPFDDWIEETAIFLSEVEGWLNDYLAEVASTILENDQRMDKCTRLHDAALEKRDPFLAAVKAQFDEAAWSGQIIWGSAPVSRIAAFPAVDRESPSPWHT